MEFFLILLHDDGVRRDYAVYRDTNLPDMSRLQDFTELVGDVIINLIADERARRPSGSYNPMIVTPTAYGAEIRVVDDAYAVLADEFNALMRNCRDDFLRQNDVVA